MRKSTRAVLLSAFVFPGSGHLVYKKYKTAVGLMSITILALSFVMTDAYRKAKLISDKILNGELDLDVSVVLQEITQAQTAQDSFLIKLATLSLIIVWLIAVVDSYRVGRSSYKDIKI